MLKFVYDLNKNMEAFAGADLLQFVCHRILTKTRTKVRGRTS